MAVNRTLHLVLYGTSACHLCDEALALFDSLALSINLEINEVDIVESDVLMARYANAIPVLAWSDNPDKELAWPFSVEQLAVFINELAQL